MVRVGQEFCKGSPGRFWLLDLSHVVRVTWWLDLEECRFQAAEAGRVSLSLFLLLVPAGELSMGAHLNYLTAWGLPGSGLLIWWLRLHR